MKNVIFGVVFMFVAANSVMAQENADQPRTETSTLQANLLPSPELIARIIDEEPPPASTPPPASEEIKRGGNLEQKLFRASQVAMVAMTAVDMAITSYYMTHPLHASYCTGAPNCEYPSVATVSFHEAGWAKVFSETNPVPVVAAHTAYTVGMLYATNWLAKKGGVWRKVATGLNLYQVSQNIDGTLHCLNSRSYSQRDLVPTGVFQVIRW